MNSSSYCFRLYIIANLLETISCLQTHTINTPHLVSSPKKLSLITSLKKKIVCFTTVSLYSSGWLQTCFVDHDALELKEICQPLPLGFLSTFTTRENGQFPDRAIKIVLLPFKLQVSAWSDFLPSNKMLSQ